MKRVLPTWQVVACAAWLIVVAVGMGVLVRYTMTPGPAARAAEAWPELSQLPFSADTPTLVMFAHPQCPCSRASVGELALLMAHVQGRVRAQVVFHQPPAAAPEWQRPSLWRAAEVIPGVDVRADVDGQEARRFGALVSGQTFLYGSDRRLLFSGGITAARGHSGANPGRAALTAILHGRQSGPVATRVFGCFLYDSARTNLEAAP